MAPEQAAMFSSAEKNTTYDEKIDIFSLGLIFWEIVTTKRPIRTTKEVKNGEFKLLEEEKHHYPGRFFKPLVINCIKFNPKKRPTAEKFEQMD